MGMIEHARSFMATGLAGALGAVPQAEIARRQFGMQGMTQQQMNAQSGSQFFVGVAGWTVERNVMYAQRSQQSEALRQSGTDPDFIYVIHPPDWPKAMERVMYPIASDSPNHFTHGSDPPFESVWSKPAVIPTPPPIDWYRVQEIIWTLFGIILAMLNWR